MKALANHLRAELLKLHRTPALLLTVVMPYVVVLLLGLFAGIQGERFLGRSDASPWPWLVETSLTIWSTVFLPLHVFLVAALVAAVEHRARGFRLLFTLPVPRWRIYAGKQAAVFLLVAGSYLLLALGILLTGGLLHLVHPELGFAIYLPWREVLLQALWGTLATSFLVALATWLSLWSRSFVIPVTIGFVATVLLLALRAAGPEMALYHPAAYAVEVVKSSPRSALFWALLGVVTGGLFSVVGGWAFLGRDVE